MAEAIVRHFKTSEKVREQNRKGVSKYQKTAKGKAANARAMKNRYAKLRAKGLCVVCAKSPHRPNSVYCQPCATKEVARSKMRRDRNVSNGICTACGRCEALETMKGKVHSFCERCYFKKTSIDCLKTAKYADLLSEKLKQQSYRCVYTGEVIVLGLNDSLDHILPISRFPHLRSDPGNVEWVTRKVNCMKWDSTREEFLETAQLVVAFAHS